MATNLLLEGENLEALLLQAKTRGGEHAKIVRADRVRSGGVLGFFARERFEVAVEIPDGEGAADGPDGGAAAGSRDGGTGADGSAGGHGDGTAAGPRSRFDIPMQRSSRFDDLGSPGTSRFDQPLRSSTGTGTPTSTSTGTRATRSGSAGGAAAAGGLTVPEPGRLAADGILGIAERVNAAERAAREGRPVARAASAAGTRSVAEADRPLVSAGTRTASRSASTAQTASTASTASTAQTAPTPPAPRIPAARRAASTEYGPSTVQADRGSSARTDASVPHEPPASPVRPSTTRPEFTALLDQLRSGAQSVPGSAPLDTEQAGPAAGRGTTSAHTTRTPHPAGGSAAGTTSTPSPAAVTPTTDTARTANPDTSDTGVATTSRTDTTTVDVQASAAPGEAAASAPASRTGRVPVPPVDRREDARLAADRRTLRGLGVPEAWTRRLRTGDRFSAVLAMLERMPDADVDPDTPVIAVVGPARAVRMEAHRTALDLAPGDDPRPVVFVPAAVGPDRAHALGRVAEMQDVVVAVEADSSAELSTALETLQSVRAGAVLVVVDAGAPLERTRHWLDALGQVDALAVTGAGSVPEPAAVLQLGLPVVRLDGIPLDRATWAALLCAQLTAASAVLDGVLPVAGTGA